MWNSFIKNIATQLSLGWSLKKKKTPFKLLLFSPATWSYHFNLSNLKKKKK